MFVHEQTNSLLMKSKETFADENVHGITNQMYLLGHKKKLEGDKEGKKEAEENINGDENGGQKWEKTEKKGWIGIQRKRQRDRKFSGAVKMCTKLIAVCILPK